LRRFREGNVVGMWERYLHLIERWSVEILCGVHAEGAIVRNLVVLVEEVIVDIVEGCGNRGINCIRASGHSEMLVPGILDERRQRQVGGVT